MEIHQLKYFICVAKLESISKAATTLHLSQPALSKSIAKLEDELGVLLFDRSVIIAAEMLRRSRLRCCGVPRCAATR